jgi:hypothetical protein
MLEKSTKVYVNVKKVDSGKFLETKSLSLTAIKSFLKRVSGRISELGSVFIKNFLHAECKLSFVG